MLSNYITEESHGLSLLMMIFFGESKFAYLSSKWGNNSLWVPLFEKAWAKMKGSYESSVNGWTQNPMRAITGSSSLRVLD